MSNGNTEALLITALVYRTRCSSHAEHGCVDIIDAGV